MAVSPTNLESKSGQGPTPIHPRTTTAIGVPIRGTLHTAIPTGATEATPEIGAIAVDHIDTPARIAMTTHIVAKICGTKGDPTRAMIPLTARVNSSTATIPTKTIGAMAVTGPYGMTAGSTTSKTPRGNDMSTALKIALFVVVGCTIRAMGHANVKTEQVSARNASDYMGWSGPFRKAVTNPCPPL